MTLSSMCAFASLEKDWSAEQRHRHEECKYRDCHCYCHRAWFFRWLKIDRRWPTT